MPFILQTSGLSKKIGSKALVTDINIHIPKFMVFLVLTELVKPQ